MNKRLQDGIIALHGRLVKQFSTCSTAELRTQFHPDLSQLGWHLSHIAFVEQYWLREVVLGDDSKTADMHQYYFPELIDKSDRGGLSGITDFAILQQSFLNAESILSDLLSGQRKHPLLEKDYIGWFLLQHGQQHLETMQMVLHQITMKASQYMNFTAKKFTALEPVMPETLIVAGGYEVGSGDVLACDNEQQPHTVKLRAYQLAQMPVSSAEYLGFMQADGYQEEKYWSKEGWQWIKNTDIQSPEYWMQDAAASWYIIEAEGASDISPESAVTGLSWYEADAFARYAGYRLPHEHEWEVAMKVAPALMHSTGKAWEWCANTFFPYDEFKAFPYERYSSPWFNNDHFTLKGHSPFSGETVSHPSFRNFYQPEKRHVFAGLRLARHV